MITTINNTEDLKQWAKENNQENIDSGYYKRRSEAMWEMFLYNQDQNKKGLPTTSDINKFYE